MKHIAILAALALAGCTANTQPDTPEAMQARAAMIQAWPGVHIAPVPFYPIQTQSTYRLQTTCSRMGNFTNCY